MGVSIWVSEKIVSPPPLTMPRLGLAHPAGLVQKELGAKADRTDRWHRRSGRAPAPLRRRRPPQMSRETFPNRPRMTRRLGGQLHPRRGLLRLRLLH